MARSVKEMKVEIAEVANRGILVIAGKVAMSEKAMKAAEKAKVETTRKNNRALHLFEVVSQFQQ